MTPALAAILKMFQIIGFGGSGLLAMRPSHGREGCRFNPADETPALCGRALREEPGPHGARSQFYPMQQANVVRNGDVANGDRSDKQPAEPRPFGEGTVKPGSRPREPLG
jgi:hypothetical protein